MKRKFFCCLVFVLLFGGKAFSYYDFDAKLRQAYSAIVRLKLNEGSKLLDEEQAENPSNRLCLLYYSYIDFLRAFISEEKKDFENFKRNSEQRFEKLEITDSPYSLYARSEMMLQDAMLKIKFHEFFSAAWEIKKVYKIAEENKRKHPGFLLNKKISGFLQVLVGSVPSDFRWLVKLAGMEGTIPQGTGELSILLKQMNGTVYDVYKEEVLFYLASISNSFSKTDSQNLWADEIKPFCSRNLLLRYCYSNLMMKAGKNGDALVALEDTTGSEKFYPFYFLNYKTGMAKLCQLDMGAEKNFRYYIDHFHGANYIRAAYQKLAWIYLLQGNLEKYFECIAMCKKSGNEFVDEDKDATFEASSGQVPNLSLLRARLLFDGGYYRQSLTEIAGKSIDNFPRFKDQLEVTYRFARILHKMNEVDKAIEYFEQTVKNGASSKFYFAANAALLLGDIYEEKNEFEKAKHYYRECLSLRHHEYQNSIDQKAKAGLERLHVEN